jgi:hypothetical protein
VQVQYHCDLSGMVGRAESEKAVTGWATGGGFLLCGRRGQKNGLSTRTRLGR